MKLRLKENVAMSFKQEMYVEIRKGIWNWEAITVEIEESDGNSHDIRIIFDKLSKGETVIVEEGVGEEVREVFDYLIKNEYLIEEDVAEERERIADVLNEQRVLLVATEEFSSILNFEQYGNINLIHFNELLQNIGLQDEEEINSMDAYTLMNIYELARRYLNPYKKIVFLVNNPCINIMNRITKIFSELNKVICYSIIDNNLLFYFVYIPDESPCFNCFNLRIKARLGDELQISYFSLRHKLPIQKNAYLNSKNINYQIAVDITIRMLIDAKKDLYGNVGSVLVFDMETMETVVEKLYKVPYCEVCGYE